PYELANDIIPFLKLARFITKLSLENNDLTGSGQQIAVMLSDENLAIHNLNLNQSFLDTKDFQDIVTAVINEKCVLTTLHLQGSTRLVYQEIALNDFRALLIVAMLNNPNCRLKKLDLASNELSQNVICSIAVALQNPLCTLRT